MRPSKSALAVIVSRTGVEIAERPERELRPLSDSHFLPLTFNLTLSIPYNK